ncbi:helix-turn-helix transcriptional regulator [Mesotoga sp.]|uniref:helix-turn-helix transcriptional regulator n=1 Tax=Mesotoga sp. TaxID=2053577 RepID=UPI00345ECBA2
MGNLRDERIMRELSQRELGEVIGKDQKYISGVELGRIIPGFRNADTLARFWAFRWRDLSLLHQGLPDFPATGSHVSLQSRFPTSPYMRTP